MARDPKPRPNRHWTQKALQDALAEHKELKTSVRDLEKKYNVPRSTIDRYINGNPGTQGRKPVSLYLDEFLMNFCSNNFFCLNKKENKRIIQACIVSECTMFQPRPQDFFMKK